VPGTLSFISLLTSKADEKLMRTFEPIATPSISTLVDLLRLRSETSPRQATYVFLRDGDGVETSCSYSELDFQARKIASWLRSEKLSGERVLLVYPRALNTLLHFSAVCTQVVLQFRSTLRA
jgi:acyl-CoA synthetase (AMP-forming)/AMP-acid ligase II